MKFKWRSVVESSAINELKCNEFAKNCDPNLLSKHVIEINDSN